MNNMRIKDIFTDFQKEHMYDADTRRRIQTLIQDYHDVVMCAGETASAFDRVLAGYAIDKWTEFEEALWTKQKEC